jgi:hypothetical protein
MERITCGFSGTARFVHSFCLFLGPHSLPLWEIESSFARFCLYALSSSSYLDDLLLFRKHRRIDLRVEKMHVGKENSNHHRNLPHSICGLINDSTAFLVESQLWPDAGAFIYGLRDRVRNQADIPAIRNWLKTLDKKDYIPRRDYLSADELPEALKAMCFGVVSLSEDKNGNPEVYIFAGGGFHHWGATIGMEDMVISESDLESRYECWLLVEPGVYVYEW